MERLTVLQKVQQEAYEAFTEARLTCDTLRQTIRNVKLSENNVINPLLTL